MLDFVSKHPLGAMSTSSSLNMPSNSWVYTFSHPDFTFYVGTRTSTQKFADLEENPYAALSFTDPVTLETLQMRGKTEMLLGVAEVRAMTDALRALFETERKKWMAPADKASHGIYNIDVSRWMPPVAQMRDGAYVFIKITPEWARYRRYDADWREGKDFTELEYKL